MSILIDKQITEKHVARAIQNIEDLPAFEMFSQDVEMNMDQETVSITDFFLCDLN